MKNIGVIGGTVFDTSLGVDILKKRGFATYALPLSKNPKEQSRMQILNKNELTDYAIKKVQNSDIEFDALFIYCNSFSAAADIKKIRETLKIKVVTPLEQYKKYAKAFSRVLILGANAQSCAKIEQILENENPSINMISVSFLPLVQKIEKSPAFDEINRDLKLIELIETFKKMELENGRIEALILGCTHFPHIAEGLKEIKDIKIIDPAADMVLDLINN